MTTIIQGRHATLSYNATPTTWDTGTALNAETGFASVAELKDVTVSLPEQESEQVLLLGASTNTAGTTARTSGAAVGVVAGTFQNSMLEVKSFGLYKVSGTAVFTGDEQFMHIIGLGAGTASGAGSAWTRYSVGNITSNNWAKTLLGTLKVYLNNGTENFTLVMSNVLMKKLSDLKPTGADGHWEVDFEAECLPRDGVIELAN